MSIQKLTWSVILTGAILTAACGDANSSMNPVAPSAVVIGAESAQAGAGDGWSTTGGRPTNPGNGNGNGNNNGGGNGNGGGGNGNGKPDNPGNGNQPTVPGNTTTPGNTTPPAPPPSNTSPSVVGKVEIEGMISAKGSDTITVNNQTVKVPATANIRHGNRSFTFADLRVGDRVHVKANRLASSSTPSAATTTTLEATEVKLQNPGDEDDDDEDDEDEGETPPSTGTTRVRPKG